MKNVFSFQCPCCGVKINAIKILHREVNNGCKSQKNKKCFYCPVCDNAMGQPHSAELNQFMQISYLLFVFFGIKMAGESLGVAFYYWFPLFILVFYIGLVIFVHLYPFKCFKETEILEREKDILGLNTRMDDKEKKLIGVMYLVPIIVIVFIFIFLLKTVLFSS